MVNTANNISGSTLTGLLTLSGRRYRIRPKTYKTASRG